MNYGKQNENFFSDKTKNLSSNVPFEKLDQYSNEMQKEFNYFNRGNFSAHIFKMIPTFYEMQNEVMKLVIENNQIKNILDLGCSEGGFIKSISSYANKFLEGSKICHGIDANIDMVKQFYNTDLVDNCNISNSAFIKGWDNIPTFEAVKKYDLITEFFLFQFMNNDRRAQIKEVKKLLNKSGLFVTCEKFINCNNFEFNEKRKNEHQCKYFSPEDITIDQNTIIAGMEKDQVSDSEYFKILSENFKFVGSFWDAGNFKGFICSDSFYSFKEIIKTMELIVY